MHDVKTFLITTVPTVPALLTALEDRSTFMILTAFVMPICFFVISKAIDVLVQLYGKPWIDERKKHRKAKRHR